MSLALASISSGEETRLLQAMLATKTWPVAESCAMTVCPVAILWPETVTVLVWSNSRDVLKVKAQLAPGAIGADRQGKSTVKLPNLSSMTLTLVKSI